MQSRIRIIKRREAVSTSGASPNQVEMTARQRERETVNTVKSWIAEWETRNRSLKAAAFSLLQDGSENSTRRFAVVNQESQKAATSLHKQSVESVVKTATLAERKYFSTQRLKGAKQAPGNAAALRVFAREIFVVVPRDLGGITKKVFSFPTKVE